MVFSSNFFILRFLPLFFLIFFISPKKYRNIITLLASFFFYAWGAPKFLFILIISLYLDFFLVKLIYNNNHNRGRIYLAIVVTLNLLLLLFFKYSNFLIENLNTILTGSMQSSGWMSIALPIGISFITFHKLTYAIDAYRRVHKPLKYFSDYLLYIMMFPHQIAGPIVRFNEIAEQLEDKEREVSIDVRLTGVMRFIEGLAKKVIIANPLGIVADQVFSANPNDLGAFNAWIGILAYTFQIYFDFSGYSDMGIGLARIMGFVFPENFNFPYISQSITEFWRRWHITLGRFMRDYLYIPLGGNRVTRERMYLNLWLVFLISGLWHGASWTFVVWGAFHGTLLILDRLFLLKFYTRIGTVPSMIIAFFLVMIGWVFFRASSLEHAGLFLKQMFILKSSNISISLTVRFKMILITAIILSLLPLFLKLKNQNWLIQFANNESLTYLISKSVLIIFLFLWSISEINSTGFNPFIYYRF